MFEKFLSRLTELSDLKLFFVRYFVNLIVFVEILLLPIIFDSNFFTEVEVLRQLYMLAPVLILGAHSGYLFLYYKKEEDSRNQLIALCIINGIVGSAFVYWYLNSVIASLALCFFLLTVALEKVLIVENQLVMASTYKSSMSLTALMLAVFVSGYDIQIAALDFYALSAILGIFFWLAYLFRRLGGNLLMSNTQVGDESIAAPAAISRLIRNGFMLSFQSYLLLIYLVYDRHYISSHYSDEYAAEYSIAFSLCQIVFIAVNTIAFSNQRKFGADFLSLDLSSYNRYIKSSFIFFFLLAAISIPCVYMFSFFVSGYGDFLKSYSILVAILGIFYVFSALSIIAYYQGQSKYMAFAFAFSLVFNIVLSEIVVGINYYLHLVQSSLILLLAGILIDRAIRRHFYKNTQALMPL